MSFLLVELPPRVFLVLGEKLFEIFIFHCTAQDLLVQLFDNFEIGKDKTKKYVAFCLNERVYDALGTQRVKIQNGRYALVALLAHQAKPVGISS